MRLNNNKHRVWSKPKPWFPWCVRDKQALD
jgi:hypothetical protein